MEKLEQIKKAIELAERGRGTAKDLIQATPIQLSIYNTFTRALNELKALKAVVEDSLGVYNVKDK